MPASEFEHIDQSAVRFINLYYGYPLRFIDSMKFAHRSRAGNLQADTGVAGVISNQEPGISWQAGDAITATWISNTYSAGQTSGFGGVFYDNLVDDLATVDVGWQFSSYQGLGSNWVSSAFGVAPN